MVPPDGEGLQLPFCRRQLHTAERICKQMSSQFYLSEDTFDSVPISAATHPKSGSEQRQRSFEMVGHHQPESLLG